MNLRRSLPRAGLAILLLAAITEKIEQRLILDMMGELAGCRVLNAACGDGALVFAAASLGADVTGINPDRADRAR